VVYSKFSFLELRKLVSEALDTISSAMIHKWYLRCMRTLEAYESGEKYGSNHLIFVKKGSTRGYKAKKYTQSGYAQQKHKTNNRTQKRKTQNPTPRSLLSLQNIPPYFEVTSTRGRRLRLAGVSICNRTAAGQPDVESLCPLWAPFRPSDDDGSRNPTSVSGQGGSRSKRSVWVVTFVAVKMVSTRWRR
jgi:hypothetical protein